MKLTLRRSDNLSDWYLIEKTEHEHKTWLDEIEFNCFMYMDSARISPDGCVEGTAEEMLAIAKAIKERRYESFKRCAVGFLKDGAHFWSPKNSRVDGVVSVEEADELADLILKELS